MTTAEAAVADPSYDVSVFVKCPSTASTRPSFTRSCSQSVNAGIAHAMRWKTWAAPGLTAYWQWFKTFTPSGTTWTRIATRGGSVDGYKTRKTANRPPGFKDVNSQKVARISLATVVKNRKRGRSHLGGNFWRLYCVCPVHISLVGSTNSKGAHKSQTEAALASAANSLRGGHEFEPGVIRRAEALPAAPDGDRIRSIA